MAPSTSAPSCRPATRSTSRSARQASGAVGGAGGAGAAGGAGGASGAGGGGGTALYFGDDASGELLALAGGGGGAGTTADGGSADNAGSGNGDVNGGDAGTWDEPGAGGTTGLGTPGGDGDEGEGGAGAATNGGGGGGGWYGGGGGASDATDGAGGGGGASLLDYADDSGTAASPGDGSVDYVFHTCGIPNAPEVTVLSVGDATADIEFWPAGLDEYDPVSAVTGWEYVVDGGAAQALTTTGTGEDLHSATITGLTNGVTHEITVHATSASGDGADSEPVEVTPYKEIGAPGNIQVSVDGSTVSFTWDAPTVSGTYALQGYEAVIAANFGESGGPVFICETAPGMRVCEGNVPPGLNLIATVTAVDAEGNYGVYGDQVPVPAIAPPASVPESDGPLTAPPGAASGVAKGETITITGTGYKPNSVVTILIYSEPQVLTAVMTDGTGSFTVEVTVPAGLPVGQHTLVAAGVDPSGAMRYMTLPVTVTEGGATLAYTGADIALPAFGGLAALALGGGLMFAARRREVSAK